MILVRWFYENGVGQNLTAGVIMFALGYLWSRTKYWPLHAIHAHLDALRASHASLTQAERQLRDHLTAVRESHARLAEHHARALRSDERLHARLGRIEELLTEKNGDGSPQPPPAKRASKAKTPPSPASRRTRRPPKA